MNSKIISEIEVVRQMIASFVEGTCSLEKTPAEIMSIYSILSGYDTELNDICEELPEDFNEVDDADIVKRVKTITSDVKRLTEE